MLFHTESNHKWFSFPLRHHTLFDINSTLPIFCSDFRVKYDSILHCQLFLYLNFFPFFICFHCNIIFYKILRNNTPKLTDAFSSGFVNNALDCICIQKNASSKKPNIIIVTRFSFLSMAFVALY